MHAGRKYTLRVKANGLRISPTRASLPPSMGCLFGCLFVWLVPFGLLKEFDKLGKHIVWLTIPFGVLVSWVFMSSEQVGESTENPFFWQRQRYAYHVHEPHH